MAIIAGAVRAKEVRIEGGKKVRAYKFRFPEKAEVSNIRDIEEGVAIEVLLPGDDDFSMGEIKKGPSIKDETRYVIVEVSNGTSVPDEFPLRI